MNRQVQTEIERAVALIEKMIGVKELPLIGLIGDSVDRIAVFSEQEKNAIESKLAYKVNLMALNGHTLDEILILLPKYVDGIIDATLYKL